MESILNISETFYIALLPPSLGNSGRCIFYASSTSALGLGHIKMLDSHMWPVALELANTAYCSNPAIC
jgi:hypothetical protein